MTTLIILVLIIILPVSFSDSLKDKSRQKTAGEMGLVNSVGRTIRLPFDWIAEVRILHNENTKLKERVAELSTQVIDLENLRRENKSLKSELDIHQKFTSFRRVVSTVISRSQPGERDHIIINQGGLSGIQKGDAIVSASYLVGKVEKTLPNSAEIVLIKSQDSIIQAKVAETGDKGIVSGSLSGIYLSDLPAGIQIKEKMIVETSGLGDSMPAGILIGEATVEKSAGQKASTSIRLYSPVDFNNLDIVFALIR